MSNYIRRFLFDPGAEVLLEIESVNILDLDPPASISGVGSGTVLLVGEFENGPFETPTEVSSATDLASLFGGFGYTYDSVPANNPCARKRTADGGNAEYWNGNGAAHLSGKKFRRLVLCRVDTSVGEVQFNRLASLRGNAAFRYDLEPGQILSWEDGSGPDTATFSAAAATVTSAAGAYPTGFLGGETLTLGYDKEPDFTVTFLATDQTIGQVVARINQYAGFTFVAGAVNQLTFTGKIRGLLGEVRIVSGSAGVLAALGLVAATTLGTGNVANIDAVQVSEIDTLVNAASAGAMRVRQDESGALKMEGSAASFRVLPTTTASALGFPSNLSSTTDSSAAVLISTPGTYPTLFAGGETVTLGIDDEVNVVVTFLVGDQTQADVITRINAAIAGLASSFSATRLQFDGVKAGGQVRVVGASAPAVLTTLGLAVVTVTGQVNPDMTIPAGTRVRVPAGQRFVTMQDVSVSDDSAGPYTVKVRHATDDGSGLVAGAGTVTEIEVPQTSSSFSVINLTPTTAALTEAQIDAKYQTAIDATLDLNSVAKEVNISYSARQSNTVRRALKANAISASSSGLFGRMACIRPPLGTTKANAKSTVAEPGVGAYREQRVIYNFPGVMTQLPAMALRGLSGGEGFDANGYVDVGSDGFCASIMSQLPPEENPGQETAFTTGAVSLERSPNAQKFTMDDYTAFKKAGICAPRFVDGTMVFQSGVTSVDPLLKPQLKNIARRRMADFIQDTVALIGSRYGKKLSLPSRRNALVGEYNAFLTGLLSPNNPASQRIDSFKIDAKTANTPQLLAAGRFRVLMAVRTLPSLDSIEIATTIGENVTVEELLSPHFRYSRQPGLSLQESHPMADQRIKGQEVSILISRGGVLEDTITEIMNFNLEIQSETKIQGYLGEKNNRTDDIFNQVKFDMEVHLSSRLWFVLTKAITDRQKRITPDVVINITVTLQFPNGDTPSVIIPDAKFGAIPHNIASRGDYVKSKLDGVADDIQYQGVLNTVKKWHTA